MANRIVETTDNSISFNPAVAEIINKYQNELDWLLYELASRTTGKHEYIYDTSVGKITINI